MKILAMQFVHHLRRIGIRAFVELHGVPAVFPPVLPVLNQRVYRNLPRTKIGRCVENLLLARVSFATLPKAVGPAGQHRSRSRKLAVLSNNLVQLRTENEVIIYSASNLRLESHRIRWSAHREFCVS